MIKIIQQKANKLLTKLADYFKSIRKDEEELEQAFEIILVDIHNSSEFDLKCVKKNMYDPDLKFIAISYRWGELNEQLVVTPDYTAHITSFDLGDLNLLCEVIKNERDLKKIQYLWIDAISVDQQNQSRKKETILKMSQIYQYASYILAIPDLHIRYLLKNPANDEMKVLIWKYSKAIHEELFNMNYSFTDSIKENKEMEKKKDKKRIYKYLAWLIEDWSNRVWVISEYHIAKEKYINYGTPLKYWFISLLTEYERRPFFSYHFNDDDNQQRYVKNSWEFDKNDEKMDYRKVNDSKTFHQFLKSRFMQRSHLDMLLNSNATRNEDRFNAILPSWNENNHIIKNKNTVSTWNITDMTSVRLKLYDIMDNLWDKATLLHACSNFANDVPIFPSFASQYKTYDLIGIIEKCNYNSVAYKGFEKKLLEWIANWITKKEIHQIKQLMDEYKTNSKKIWVENLTNIELEQNKCCLSIKSKSYFIKKESKEEYWRQKLSLKKQDEIFIACIPFFTFNIPGYSNSSCLYFYSSRIFLVGSMNENKWMLTSGSIGTYKSEHFCSDDNAFNIY